MNKTQFAQCSCTEGHRKCYRNIREQKPAHLEDVREGFLAELTPTLTLKSRNVLVYALYSEKTHKESQTQLPI